MKKTSRRIEGPFALNYSQPFLKQQVLWVLLEVEGAACMT